jgi:hypothetical protein
MRALVLIFAIASLVGGLLCNALLSRLRSRHPQMWEAMGRPNPFFFLYAPGGIAGRIAMLRFLWHEDYLVLQDSQLTSLARFIRLYFAGYLVLLFVMIARLIWIL